MMEEAEIGEKFEKISPHVNHIAHTYLERKVATNNPIRIYTFHFMHPCYSLLQR